MAVFWLEVRLSQLTQMNDVWFSNIDNKKAAHYYRERLFLICLELSIQSLRQYFDQLAFHHMRADKISDAYADDFTK